MENKSETTSYLDLEDYASNGKPIPAGCRHFTIRINGERYRWNKVRITGREILKLAELKPIDQYQVDQHFRFGRVEQVEPDEVVDLASRGVERFTTSLIDDCKITIIVNGRPKEVEQKEITYREVVKLAFPNATFGTNIVYTVTYKGAADDCKPQGQLTPNSHPVKIKNKTKFNVTRTDKS